MKVIFSFLAILDNSQNNFRVFLRSFLVLVTYFMAVCKVQFVVFEEFKSVFFTPNYMRNHAITTKSEFTTKKHPRESRETRFDSA